MPTAPAVPAAAPALVLERVLQVMRPLVRLMLRHGITYTVLAAALKKVFLDGAREELQRKGMATTDSALTLLSGVHRRDVRTLTRGPAARDDETSPHGMSLASQVVGRWMNERAFTRTRGQARPLVRGTPDDGRSFDALVARVSSDVRPRAVLDELLRLGVAVEEGEGAEATIRLTANGFAPRQGFEPLAQLFAANLHDHAAASVANLTGDGKFLEQAVFVDEIGAASVERLKVAAQAAWQQAFVTVMTEAHQRLDADAALPRAERNRRTRFGVYFYSEEEKPS